MKLNLKSTLLLGLLAAALFSCKKKEDDTGQDLVLTPTEQQKVVADNAFTIKLFKSISLSEANDHNVFMSPLSASFAIAMTANGAKGATLDSINKVMKFTGFTQSQVNDYYNKMIITLPELDPSAKLSIANSIWYRQGLNVMPAFVNTNSEKYLANVQALDFNSPSAKTTINDWVSNKTNGKIPAIIDAIPANVSIYLINALYFKSAWKTKFDAASTAQKPFYFENGAAVQADFMTKPDVAYNTNYIPEDSTLIAELPYIHGKYSMVFVLPGERNTVKHILAGITATKWQQWMKDLYEIKGRVTMPKFKYSFAKSFKEPLKALGMNLAFNENADFSGITGGGGLMISDVQHKAFIEVNEEGTEAAAATSVSGAVTAPAPRPDLVLNRPFIFAIREMKSGLILFTGIINNPTLSGQ